MNYELFPKVSESGFVNPGFTAIINDRNTSVTVPWAVTQTGNKNIVWSVKSDNGTTYTVTVPVTVAYNSSAGTSTATYTKGTYTVAGPQS